MPKRSQTRPSSAFAFAFALALLLAVAAACSTGSDSGRENAGIPATSRPVEPSTTPTTGAAAESAEATPATVRLVAAGDIACVPGREPRPGECRHGETAALAETLSPAIVMPLGDLQYERGEAQNFEASYAPTWGRLRDKTRPVVGNHEYAGGRARGYYEYFGAAAHPDRGWYSFDVPEVGWHIVVINSVCSVVGCGEGSEQLAWLRADLAAHANARCTIAAWHHARFSSGLHGSDESMQPVWQALVDARADVVLSGHDHHYERFAPRDGVRQFVAGTGGRSLYPVIRRLAGSEFVTTSHFGVLELLLRDGSYDWRFHALGAGVIDEGTSACT